MTYPIVINTCLVLVTVILLFAKVLSEKTSNVHPHAKKYLRQIIWNAYLRVFLEEYLIISIACIVRLFNL